MTTQKCHYMSLYWIEAFQEVILVCSVAFAGSEFVKPSLPHAALSRCRDAPRVGRQREASTSRDMTPRPTWSELRRGWSQCWGLGSQGGTSDASLRSLELGVGAM